MSQPTQQTETPQANPSQQPTPQPESQGAQENPSNPPQQTQPQQTTGNSPSHSSGLGTGQQLLTELRGLPEKIVNAMREAMQPSQPQQHASSPAKQQSSADSGNTSQSSASTTQQPPSSAPKSEPGNVGAKSAQQRFAEWWFKS